MMPTAVWVMLLSAVAERKRSGGDLNRAGGAGGSLRYRWSEDLRKLGLPGRGCGGPAAALPPHG